MQYLPLQRTEPFHQHDSDNNPYRGSFLAIPSHRREGVVHEDAAPSIIDVYVEGDLIIKRFSSDPPDFASFPRHVVEMLLRVQDEHGGHASDDWKMALDIVQTSKLMTGPRHNGDPTGELFAREPYNCDRYMSWDTDPTGSSPSRRSVWIISWPSAKLGDLDEEGKERYVREIGWPATFCQHSYDCCGHWYQSAAKITKLPSGRWLISQSSHMNV